MEALEIALAIIGGATAFGLGLGTILFIGYAAIVLAERVFGP